MADGSETKIIESIPRFQFEVPKSTFAGNRAIGGIRIDKNRDGVIGNEIASYLQRLKATSIEFLGGGSSSIALKVNGLEGFENGLVLRLSADSNQRTFLPIEIQPYHSENLVNTNNPEKILSLKCEWLPQVAKAEEGDKAFFEDVSKRIGLETNVKPDDLGVVHYDGMKYVLMLDAGELQYPKPVIPVNRLFREYAEMQRDLFGNDKDLFRKTVGVEPSNLVESPANIVWLRALTH